MISPTRPSPGFSRVLCTAEGLRPSVANNSRSSLARRRYSEHTSATICRAMIRTTMSSRAWAGPPPSRASRIWRSKLRGPRTAKPVIAIDSPFSAPF